MRRCSGGREVPLGLRLKGRNRSSASASAGESGGPGAGPPGGSGDLRRPPPTTKSAIVRIYAENTRAEEKDIVRAAFDATGARPDLVQIEVLPDSGGTLSVRRSGSREKQLASLSRPVVDNERRGTVSGESRNHSREGHSPSSALPAQALPEGNCSCECEIFRPCESNDLECAQRHDDWSVS